jgi:hypothetical protein
MSSTSPGHARTPGISVELKDRRLPLHMHTGAMRARLRTAPRPGGRSRGSLRRYVAAVYAPLVLLTTLRPRGRQRLA